MVGSGDSNKHTDALRLQQAAENTMLVIDSSSLRHLASPIFPELLKEDSPDKPYTLLEFIRKVMDMGVRVILPETVIFETIGQDKDGDQLEEIFCGNPEFPFIVDFIESVRGHENFEIVAGEKGRVHMDEFRRLKGNNDAFSAYKRKNRADMADDSIVDIISKGNNPGFVFLLTEDKKLKRRFPEPQNAASFPISNINTGAFIASIVDVELPDCVNHNMFAHDAKEMINAEIDRINELREAEGRGRKMTPYNDSSKQKIPEGGIAFSAVLHRINNTNKGMGL
jgi:hypothetical protein